MRRLSGYGPSLVVLITTALILWAGPKAVKQLTYHQTRARILQAGQRLEGNDVLQQLNQAYRDIADFVEPSVVHISASQLQTDLLGRERAAVSSGSGWVYDIDGHIVTNFHVVENANRIEVQLHTGELRDAELVGFDQFTDIAVLKTRPGELHPATLAEADEAVERGDLVYAFGSPFDFRFSMSSGVVSGTGRSVGVIRDRSNMPIGFESFIQIDAAINPGNSGGPLTDYRGRVVGMNTAIATGGRSSAFDEGQFAGIGLAIPLSMIEPVVTQLIETGIVSKGHLGVEARDLMPQDIDQLQTLGFIGRGVIVERVVEDAPAHRGGVRVGDVITHVDGREVGSLQALRSVISSSRPGQNVDVDLWRNDGAAGGTNMQIQVALATRPRAIDRGREMPNVLPLLQLGIRRLTTSTPQTADHFGTEFVEGAVIEGVVSGSDLERQGVRAGAVIVAVRDFPITSLDDFVAHLEHTSLVHGIPISIVDTDGRRRRAHLSVEPIE